VETSKDVDGRIKPGHDELRASRSSALVIASAAKQSIENLQLAKSWIASSLSLLAMTRLAPYTLHLHPLLQSIGLTLAAEQPGAGGAHWLRF